MCVRPVHRKLQHAHPSSVCIFRPNPDTLFCFCNTVVISIQKMTSFGLEVQGGQVRPQYCYFTRQGVKDQTVCQKLTIVNLTKRQKVISRRTHLNTRLMSRTNKLTEIRILLSQMRLQANFKIFGQSLQNLLENKKNDLVLNSLNMNMTIWFDLLPFLRDWLRGWTLDLGPWTRRPAVLVN
jgi:hypothetical protein